MPARFSPFLLALVTLLATLVTATAQTVRHVPSTYYTIQSAIDAAKNGDTVLVQGGLYIGNISFNGKNITVKSALGPKATAIQGGGSGSVVTFAGNEGPGAVLEGFTITGGLALNGGGIYCPGASAVIRGNIIENNKAEADGGYCRGGGIYCLGGAPAFEANIIRYNQANGSKSMKSTTAKGGGLYLEKTNAKILNCIVDGNSATPGGMSFPPSSYGGGLYSEGGSVTITNATFLANIAMSNSPFQSVGGGMYCVAGTLTVTNSIVWNNNATGSRDQIAGSGVSVTYSNVEYGKYGTGNINQDPKFVYRRFWVGENDAHIGFDSPCVDAGTATAPGLPARDIDGNPRKCGSAVDMGADEVCGHVYYTGKAAGGSTYHVVVVGPPGHNCIWAHSLYALSPPVAIPGLKGLFHLHPSFMQLYPFGAMPKSGVIRFPITLPYGVPTISVPMQALLDLQLTDMTPIHVVQW